MYQIHKEQFLNDLSLYVIIQLKRRLQIEEEEEKTDIFNSNYEENLNKFAAQLENKIKLVLFNKKKVDRNSKLKFAERNASGERKNISFEEKNTKNKLFEVFRKNYLKKINEKKNKQMELECYSGG